MQFILFCIKLFKKSKENDLYYYSNALTFKIILSFFPFLIFLMTLSAFFNIDLKYYPSIQSLYTQLPDKLKSILDLFFVEVISTKRPSLLSSSLAVSIFSSSSGFKFMIKGLNKAYNGYDNRSSFKLRILSILLLFIFTFLIFLSLLLFVFQDKIKLFLINIGILATASSNMFNLITYIINCTFLFFTVMLIYKISLCKKFTFSELYIGALATVISWSFSCKLFNIYINNFSRYSKVYGSIGSVFVLFFWLNMITFLLLLGEQINAIIFEKKHNLI